MSQSQMWTKSPQSRLEKLVRCSNSLYAAISVTFHVYEPMQRDEYPPQETLWQPVFKKKMSLLFSCWSHPEFVCVQHICITRTTAQSLCIDCMKWCCFLFEEQVTKEPDILQFILPTNLFLCHMASNVPATFLFTESKVEGLCNLE